MRKVVTDEVRFDIDMFHIYIHTMIMKPEFGAWIVLLFFDIYI